MRPQGEIWPVTKEAEIWMKKRDYRYNPPNFTLYNSLFLGIVLLALWVIVVAVFNLGPVFTKH